MPKKLLLADDSITIQKVIGITFANEDYELTVVDNGADALEKARQIRPDLILADVVMPEKGGFEVCREIKSDPALSGIPVILLAGTFEPFDEDRLKQVGADDYIIKPFESQELIDKVKRQLEKAPEEKPEEAAAATAVPEAAEPSTPEEAAEEEVLELAEEDILELTEEEEAPAAAEGTLSTEEAEEELWSMEEFEEAGEEAGERVPEEAISDDELWSGIEFGEEEGLEAEEETETHEEKVGQPYLDEELAAFGFEEEEVTEAATEAAEESIEREAEIEELTESAEEEVAEAFPAGSALPVGEELFDLEEGAEILEEELAAEESSPAPEVEAKEAPSMEEEARADVGASPVTEERVEAGIASIPEERMEEIVAEAAREVVEKIAWEVIPELAETLIKEEIRRLKEQKDD